MAETIYTIPINEAFSRRDGCPLCRLRADLEEKSLEYVMGAAMMEPDVRIETNRLGFCTRHFDKMLNMKNRLGLALILESHVAELSDLFAKPAPSRKKSLFGAKPSDDGTASDISRAADSCYVCNRVEGFMDKYYSNILFLWKSDADFKEKFKSQPFFCLEHCGGLLRRAPDELGGKAYDELHESLMGIERLCLEKLRKDLSAFTKSFDHRYAAMPLGDDERHAVENTIEFLGRGPR